MVNHEVGLRRTRFLCTNYYIRAAAARGGEESLGCAAAVAAVVSSLFKATTVASAQRISAHLSSMEKNLVT